MSSHHRRLRHLLVALLVFPRVACALDGGNAVFATVPAGATTGWKTFEIISANDPLGALAQEGFNWVGEFDDWDGLGAYRHDANTLRVFVNHEEKENSTFTRVDLNVLNLKAWIASGIPNNTNAAQVLPAGAVVQAVSRGWLTVGSGTNPLNNPCSGNVWPANTFGEGLGFIDSLYMTAEEVMATRNGHIWVMDLSTRILYEAVDLGLGSWENAVPIDTGRTDTIAIMLSEDAGSSNTGKNPLQLYVGTKVPGSTDFLERNGLTNGTIYYWHADSGLTNGTTTSPSPGIFSAGNGTVVSGSWSTSAAGAVLFSKSEDLHPNMDLDSKGYGVEVVLASQKQALFLVDCSEFDFTAGDLAVGARDSDITVLYMAGTQAAANPFFDMDNVVWSADGLIYVNEDDQEGDIWAVDPASLLADYAVSDFTPSAAQVYEILDADFVKESSGIIDVSAALDFAPGSVFLTSGQADITRSANQIAMCVSPTATLLDDIFDNWILGFPALDTAAKRLPGADPDADGIDNQTEFAFDLAPHVPDPGNLLAVTRNTSTTGITFTPGQSLDLVDYFIDHTDELSSGFDQSIPVTALQIDGSGLATVTTPTQPRQFFRVRAVLP